jgi:hypothetical protein
MVALTDSQLRTVRAAADRVPAEKRGTFVDRVVARLQRQRGCSVSAASPMLISTTPCVQRCKGSLNRRPDLSQRASSLR